jgi:alanyl-tRNA synthetase
MKNRIERWFDRHTIESTHRKMREWETDNYYEFFNLVFMIPLTRQEINDLERKIEWILETDE